MRKSENKILKLSTQVIVRHTRSCFGVYFIITLLFGITLLVINPPRSHTVRRQCVVAPAGRTRAGPFIVVRVCGGRSIPGIDHPSLTARPCDAFERRNRRHHRLRSQGWRHGRRETGTDGVSRSRRPLEQCKSTGAASGHSLPIPATTVKT